MAMKQVFATAINDVRINPPTLPEALGTLRYELNNVYRYVAFSGTTAIAAGDVVSYVTFATDGKLNVVDKVSTAMGAGIAQGAVPTGTIAAGAAAYATGWILIGGVAVVNAAIGGTSPVLGDALTTAGAANGALIKGAGTAYAICYDATAKSVMCSFPGT